MEAAAVSESAAKEEKRTRELASSKGRSSSEEDGGSVDVERGQGGAEGGRKGCGNVRGRRVVDTLL